MANKRTIKRHINYVCGELFAECVAMSMYNAKVSEEDLKAMLASILVIHNDFIKRVSHPEPGMKPSLFYKNLINNFNKQVTEVIDQISNAD